MKARAGPSPTRSADGSRVSDYDYELPSELIAQQPEAQRDGSRLMVVPPSGDFQHRRFTDLAELVRPGDVFVVNESRVLAARLLGRKPTGAAAEVLLVRPVGDEWALESERWEALVRPGRKLGPGKRVVVGPDLVVEVLDSLPSGNRLVRVVTSGSISEAIERHGHMPLPPYIERPDAAEDRERYQTVYARALGSIAAPTAGLHFTASLLDELEAAGATRAAVTLHVGVGTFRPVDGDDPSAHDMHAEWFSVSEETAAAVNRARASGGRVWAIGTTAVRALESAAADSGQLRAGQGDTRLFIRPGYDFNVVDGLVTNFHLPRSTLLMLVSALAGYTRVMDAYAEAIGEAYRFYSYGDAMVVTPGP